MRTRNLALILAVFGAAAAAAAFVVRQLPREGQVSPPGQAPVAPAPAEVSPPALALPGPGDGELELRVTAGPEPLGGAEVRLYAAPEAPGAPWRRAGEARTDGAGTARLAARPGAYLVSARAPGLAPGRAEVIRGAGEPPTRADLVLEPPGSIEGRVSAGGGPVAGARVRLVPRVSRWPGLGPPSAPPEETAEVDTDAAGAFRVGGLSRGSWALALEASGFHPVLLPLVSVPGDAVVVRLERIGTVDGVALLPDGRPAAGATVRAASAEHGALARSGPDGRFHLAVPPGSYTLLALLGDRGGGAIAPVPVAAGATAHAPPLHLVAAASIQGTSRRAGGTPAPGAEVALLVHGTREVVARAVAGDGGRFALGPLAPGAYDLVATARQAAPALLEGLTLGAGQRFAATVTLRAPGGLAGTVRDPGGRPLAGVRVRATAPSGAFPPRLPVETRSDFDGRFRLAPVDPGRIELVAREDALALGAGRVVEVTEGRDTAVDLVLAPSGVLAGRVAEPGRRPPAGTTVVAVPLRAGGVAQVASAGVDASGHFELALPADDYRVHAAPAPTATADQRVTPTFARVEAGRTTRLELPLSAGPDGAGVEILVLEPGGAPSPRATVTVSRPDDDRVALAAETGDDGRALVDPRMGLAERAVTVRARNGGRSGSTTVTLPQAGTVALQLTPGGAVAGVVPGARAGFTLEVSTRPAAGSWRTVEVHRFAGERFALGDLPAEPLRLVARLEDGRRGTVDLRLAAGETRTVEIALR